MMLTVPGVFTSDEAARIREQLGGATWVDGKSTAGVQSGEVKRNRQVDEDDPVGRALGDEIIRRLTAHAVFMSAALP